MDSEKRLRIFFAIGLCGIVMIVVGANIDTKWLAVTLVGLGFVMAGVGFGMLPGE